MAVGESLSSTVETGASAEAAQAALQGAGVTVEMPEPATAANEAVAPARLPANHPLVALQEREAAEQRPNYNRKRFFTYY